MYLDTNNTTNTTSELVNLVNLTTVIIVIIDKASILDRTDKMTTKNLQFTKIYNFEKYFI